MFNTFSIQDNEGVIDYILRLSDVKKDNKDITWQFIADCVHQEYGLSRSESWVRKTVKDALGLSNNEEDLLEQIKEQKQLMDETYINIRKEKVKLSDERCQVNAYYRALSREDTIKEIALVTAQEMSNKKILPTYVLKDSGDKEAILCISDWHYGIEITNPWNEFSPEKCKERVSKLLEKTIKRVKENKVKRLHLANLGDLIAGRIHLGLRLDSRFDVITQTIGVSEILAEFISSLSKYVKVEYYDCVDNHSRLEPNKKEAQELETLARIIPWYLKERLKDNVNFCLHENEFGADLITFETMGYKVIGCHGDKDPIKNIDHLSMMTEQHYDLLLTAHAHHFACEEKNRTVALGNGTLMGTDSFAQRLRLSSTPSQNLIIVSNDNPTECIYRIVL